MFNNIFFTIIFFILDHFYLLLDIKFNKFVFNESLL